MKTRAPFTRLTLEYDLDRVEFIRASRVPLPPTLITLIGGPCDGYQRLCDIVPDLLLVDDEGGRYAPLAAEPSTYVWLGQ